MQNRLSAIAALCTLTLGCSTAPDGVAVHDPYEDRNRAVHDFNKSLTSGFGGESDRDGPVLPPVVSEPVINFADNLSLPGIVVNNLLQGDPEAAISNTVRFVINTTLGIGGLFDPADAAGLAEVDADFGGTLAVWGAPEGAYLELPLVGPSTERDTAGMLVDLVLDPLGYLIPVEHQWKATVAGLAGRVAKIDQAGDVIGDVLNESADSYTQTRLIYLQNRRFELGIAPQEAVDPYAELFGDLE